MFFMFGEKLKLALQQRGVSQKSLAGRTKISAAAISRYIDNDREPTAQNLILIADALGIEYGEILSWFKDGKPNLKRETAKERAVGYLSEMSDEALKDHADALELRMQKGDRANAKEIEKAIPRHTK